ncbi:VWA domain-containing protein [Trinickia sp. LjRoot230]|uniref:hypothetical protein n=1 Tax=Trinickia sp. LjRoot230 TaxID=3342288 RepID=UPI003ECF8185
MTPQDQGGGASQGPTPRSGGLFGGVLRAFGTGSDAPRTSDRPTGFSVGGSHNPGVRPQSGNPVQSRDQQSGVRVSYLKTPADRLNFYKDNALDLDFVRPEEAALIADKQTIFMADTSGSMLETVTKTALDGTPLPPEPRFKEQFTSAAQLLTMLQAFSKAPTRLYDLKGGYVSEASPDDLATRRLFEAVGGGTPLAGTLKKIESDLKSERSNKRVVIYISTDGNPTDVLDSSGYAFDRTASRLAFEKQLRHLIDDGIVSDDEIYRREVFVSIQYVGDDVGSFTYPEVPKGLSEEEAKRFRLDAVRRHGSAGAYYAALDDEKCGGIKRLDVCDDLGSEMRNAQRFGYNPTVEDLTLKKMIGPLVPGLDNLNERRR